MGEPRPLLLDEPSIGLAPKVVAELYASLGALLGTGLTVLVVEQNARAALRFAKRGAVFEDGRITFQGGAASLIADSRVMSAYVGALGGYGWAGSHAARQKSG